MRKKLLFIHNKLVCGGAENALFSLLCLLDKNKYDITVFVLNDGGEWEQKFQNEGIRVIHSYSRLIPGQRVRNFIRRKRVDWARRNSAKNLIRIVTREKFDLVLGYHVPAAFMYAGLELRAKKIRYIHGDARQDHVLKNNLKASNKCIKQYDRVICVSHTAKQAFEDVTGIYDKTSVCYNPIDSEKIYTGGEKLANITLPKKYICAVGRLSIEKGFARLIRIHKELNDEGVAHHLVIVGDGPEREHLEKLAQELGVEDTLLLVGYQQNPYPYMKNSLFTVCSSFTEGLPVIAMESLCLGIPIVSAYPSVGELFDGKCCGIITKNDDKSLKMGIRKMLTDMDYYKETVLHAQQQGKAFSAEAMIAQVEGLFDAVIEGGQL